MLSPRSITSALPHQAKRFGYASTSLTMSNICAGEYFTKALRRIWITAPSLQESRSSPRTGKLCGATGQSLTDMAKAKDKDKKETGGTIALNKRARHEYHIDQRFEAGIALQGWELKALRAGRINFGDGYAVVLKGEIFLVGTSI